MLMKKFKDTLAGASPDGFAARTAEFLHERQANRMRIVFLGDDVMM